MSTPRISPKGFLLVGHAKVCRVVPGGLEFLPRGRHGDDSPIVLSCEELLAVIAIVRGIEPNLLQSKMESAIVASKGDL